VSGSLHKRILVDESFWTLEDGKEVNENVEVESFGRSGSGKCSYMAAGLRWW